MEEQTQHRTTSSVRLRFVLGGQARDLALPAEVPLVDLLPAVLTQFGAQKIEEGAEHEGWVVQRVGEGPFDVDRSVVELGVLDGECLYLRPRADQLAAVDYDDLVDGVAEQVREHPAAVTPARIGWLFRSSAMAALLLGWFLSLPGTVVAESVLLPAGLACLLLTAAALVARGAAKPAAAVVLAGAAVVYSAVAGLSAVLLVDPAANSMMCLTCASACALLALAIGVMAVADAASMFTAAILVAIVLLVTGLIGAVTPADAAQSAAIGLVFSLIAALFIPPLAFRLSGLSLPMLPTGAEELHEDIDSVPHKVIVERGSATFGYSTALHVGIGAAQTALVPVLLLGGDVWHVIFALTVALLLTIRSRHPNGTVQRWATLVPAVAIVAIVVAAVGFGQQPGARWIVVVPIVFLAGLLLFGGEHLPGRRFRPYWGRTVEILELIIAIAVLPILLEVLHVYTFMRNLAG